ncbi:MAG TPA: bifunctional histidinol-phosphatase/imidazoleglycerol-phosphate dehydratase HisB [Bacteroidales bacterium]|nr:bifunctional histidinol-phosphatase/imidazoleglycerol-phosphate dehydratase HisB [Bacteroidales bacterium]
MKKKALFIDRDGTMIVEPPETKQVDTLEQLEFMPKVIRSLSLIRKNLDFEMVMVTNQDGLGTPLYPQENFDKVQGKMMQVFESEDIFFDAVFIDKSFPEDNKPTRKPGTAMLTGYMNGSYDMSECYVIGDRMSDVMLARNLGCKAIVYGAEDKYEDIKNAGLENYCALVTEDWEDIYSFLALPERIVHIRRVTSETDVNIKINLDGRGIGDVSSGLKFFDHMLMQIARHSGIDMTIEVNGDLDVDEHHSIEDTGIALGEAIKKAIGNKAGMARYGFCLPMDDCLAQVAIDFGGRCWLVWDAEFKREMVGDMPTEMFYHFFKSFSDAAGCNLNIKAEGQNEHHKIEAIFKAFARAIRMALRRDPCNAEIPSTKGVL